MSETRIGISFPGKEAVFSWLKPEYNEAIALAQAESDRLGHDVVGTEHLLLGLIREEKGIAAQALKSIGVTLEKVQHEVEKIRVTKVRSTDVESSFSPEAKHVIEKTLVVYRDTSKPLENFIGTESLLLAIVGKEEGEEMQEGTTCTAVIILQSLEVNFPALRSTVMQLFMQSAPDETIADI